MLLLVAFFVIFAISIYLFYYQEAQYWKRRNVPGPTPKLFFGNWEELDQIDSPAVLKFPGWTKKYGKYFGLYEGIRKVLVISDLEMVQDLFIRKFDYFYTRKVTLITPNPDTDPLVNVLTARGARWKRIRTTANPSFSRNSLKKVTSIVEDAALTTLRLLGDFANSGKSIDIAKFHQEYTLDIICRIAMGQKGSRQFQNPYAELVLGWFMRRLDNPAFYAVNGMPFLGAFIRKLITLTPAYRKSVIPRLYAALTKTVEERKQLKIEQERNNESKPEYEDFIDLFLEAESEETLENPNEFDRKELKIDKRLTISEIVGHCFVFLLAGFDTTANSLSYASYLLAKHPDKQRKAREEIDTLCTDDTISYETIGQLQYLDYIVKETLRFYPVASFTNARVCDKATTLGDVAVEKGVAVMADVWTIHYSKEIWGEDAEEFIPERWEDARPKHPLAWLPFGAGPRQCIGMRLAYLEQKMLLAHILRKYKILRGPDSEKDLKLIGNFTVSPESVTVYLESRDDK